MPPRRSTKRAYSEPPVDEVSIKKRKQTDGKREVSPSPSSSDFSPDEDEGHSPLAPEDPNYVDYSAMSQGDQHEGSSLPTRQQRWKHNGDEPITDPTLVPEGWNANELDLDVNDIDSQIERCVERISDGILPDFFKFRLSQYERRRAARDEMVHSEPAGLSWDIVRRLNHLKEIEAHLNTNRDPDNQLPNVKALTKAYREGNLGWSRGLVSYWSNGVQLNEPQKFDAEFHKNLAKQYDTTKAWWVEGLLPPGHGNLGALHSFPSHTSYHSVKFPVDISVDSQRNGLGGINMLTLHDTGADIMGIPQCYIDQLEAMGLPVYVQGYNIMTIPGGWSCHKIVEIDVRLTDANGAPLSHWTRVQACVMKSLPGDTFGMTLSGPFLRFVLYTATCPDGQGLLYVCDHKKDLRKLPALPNDFVPRGPPHLPTAPPAPGGGQPPESLMRQVNAANLPAVLAPILPLPPKAPKAPAKRGRKRTGKGVGP